MLTVLLLVALGYYIIVRNEKQAKTKTCIKLGELLAYSLGLGGALVLLFPEPLQERWLLDFLLSLAAALVGILFYRFVVRIAEGAQMSRRTYETDPGYGWKSFFSAVSAILVLIVIVCAAITVRSAVILTIYADYAIAGSSSSLSVPWAGTDVVGAAMIVLGLGTLAYEQIRRFVIKKNREIG